MSVWGMSSNGRASSMRAIIQQSVKDPDLFYPNLGLQIAQRTKAGTFCSLQNPKYSLTLLCVGIDLDPRSKIHRRFWPDGKRG